ncbi:MAG: FAD binding domain-containing protein [Gammaproteobacteria bacterium]
MQRFEWQRANTPEMATAHTRTTAQAMLSLDKEPEAHQSILIKAGGVDLLDLMKAGLVVPKRLVDISQLHELEGISRTAEGGFRIGTLTTLAQIAGHETLAQQYPALIDAVASAASPQIRNRATIGGNLLQRPRCWYLRSAAHHCLRKGGAHCFALDGDNRYHAIFANQSCAIVHASTPATPLLAFSAEVELRNHDGKQRRVALKDFFRLPQADLHRENILADGELLTAVLLPPPSPANRSVYLEVGEKAAFDWPLAAVSIVLQMARDQQCQQASIVLGAVAPIPWQASAAEAVVQGARINSETARAAAEAALTDATPLADNGYKLHLVKTLVQRAIMSTVN